MKFQNHQAQVLLQIQAHLFLHQEKFVSAQNVYVRFAPTAAQVDIGNIYPQAPEPPADKAVSGTGVYAEPTNQPTNFYCNY